MNFDLDIPNESGFNIAQANINNPKPRNDNFIKNSLNLDIRSETTNILNITKSENIDILLFPEHGINLSDIQLISNFVKKIKF